MKIQSDILLRNLTIPDICQKKYFMGVFDNILSASVKERRSVSDRANAEKNERKANHFILSILQYSSNNLMSEKVIGLSSTVLADGVIKR